MAYLQPIDEIWALSRRRPDLLKNFFFCLSVWHFPIRIRVKGELKRPFSDLAESGSILQQSCVPRREVLCFSCHISQAPASTDYPTEITSRLGY